MRRRYVLGFSGFVWRYNGSDEAAVRWYFTHPTPEMEVTGKAFRKRWADFAHHGFAGGACEHAQLRGAVAAWHMAGRRQRTSSGWSARASPRCCRPSVAVPPPKAFRRTPPLER